jgi:hypothetical protein
MPRCEEPTPNDWSRPTNAGDSNFQQRGSTTGVACRNPTSTTFRPFPLPNALLTNYDGML